MNNYNYFATYFSFRNARDTAIICIINELMQILMLNNIKVYSETIKNI